MELRRFRMLENKNAEEFFNWCNKKNLSRGDLITILTSVELNPEVVTRHICDVNSKGYPQVKK